MNPEDTRIKELARELLDELFLALGFTPEGWMSRVFSPLFKKAMVNFSRIATQFEAILSEEGFQTAASWFISNFVARVEALGMDNIPQKGPLIIASNHPGAYDSLVIAAHIPRDDIRIISSHIPFLKKFPQTEQYLIFSDQDAYTRMRVVRESIRHLKEGGALLVFARGSIDPDPAYMPEAWQELDLWSPSLGMFLKRVPHTRLSISLVSKILAPGFIKHPFTLFRKERIDKQRISEFFQVMQQVLKPGRVMVSPHLTFSPSLTLDDLPANGDMREITRQIIQEAQRQMTWHIQGLLPERIEHMKPAEHGAGW